MRFLMGFDGFMRLSNNLHLQLYYEELDDRFKIYSLLEGHVFCTERLTRDFVDGYDGAEFELVRHAKDFFIFTYLREAFAVSTQFFQDWDDGYPRYEEPGNPDDYKRKETTTQTGGAGTAGDAMVPVALNGKWPELFIRRCDRCGYEGRAKAEAKCPKCEGIMKSTATGAATTFAEMKSPENVFTSATTKSFEVETMKSLVGWNYIPFIRWILKFLSGYKFPQVSEIDRVERTALRQILIESVEKGNSIPVIAQRLEAELGFDPVKAEAVARTEIARAANAGAVMRYKDEGVEKVRFLASPNACPICAPYNMKEFEIGAEPDIPGDTHTNCRCTLAPVV